MPVAQEHVAELLAIQRRRNELLREQERVTKGYGLLNYRPHDGQHKFHRAGNYRFRLAMCGNRFGKSHMGAAEDCAWLRGERIWYPASDPTRVLGIPQRPVNGLVITTDWDKVDEIWTSQRGDRPGKLWQLLSKEMVVSTRRNHSGAIDNIEVNNGKWKSQLRFDTVKSWKANPMGSESSDYDFIHVDEPCPEKMFTAAARGLIDRGGSVWFTLTPLNEMWILDRFFPAEANARNLPDSHINGSYWAMRGSMHDNPYLSEEGKKEYLATLSDEERECREQGVPLELSGLVYKEFDYDKHVLKSIPFGWKDFSTPPQDWPVYVYIDVHPRKPHAVLFQTVSPFGQIFYFHEIYVQVKIEDLCDMIHQIVDPYNVVWIKCDPSAWVNDPVSGETMAEVFWKKGIMVEKATKALALGIMTARNSLSRPGLIYVSPLLREFLFEVNRYVWKDDTEKPVDERDHQMENFYRSILSEPVWSERQYFANKPIEDMAITGPDFHKDEAVNLNDL